MLAIGLRSLPLLLPSLLLGLLVGCGPGGEKAIQKVGMAVIVTESATKRIPPAIVRDKDGKPLYSGLVLALRWFGDPEAEQLFQEFHLDEPWNSPHNLPLSQRTVKILQNPASTSTMPNRTDFQLILGKGTFSDGEGKPHWQGLGDAAKNILLVVEIQNSQRAWSEPGGFDLDHPPASHASDVLVCYLDNHVGTIPKDATPEYWRYYGGYRNQGQGIRPPER